MIGAFRCGFHSIADNVRKVVSLGSFERRKLRYIRAITRDMTSESPNGVWPTPSIANMNEYHAKYAGYGLQ